jgi:cytochrome d ubiquinol oxidase subunit I
MELDALFLSRLQFAWVVAWHILLPALTIGLASYIVVLEGVHLATGRDVFVRVSQFWIKIFAVSFGLGVVTGIVMPFQFGTNWSRFTDATADVISPLLAYEGLTAFFLEAAFLGVLLFGRNRVPPVVYFFAALMVAVGTLFSSFWILAVNSWMQTPAGHEIVDGRFHPVDWMQVIFTPSFPYRLAHTVVGFYVTAGFVVLGVGAYTMRRGRLEEGRVMFTMAAWLLTALVPLQIFIGDLHGLNTLKHQPAKIAAMEGLWDTAPGVPFTVFAIPDEEAERNRLAIEIPKAGSLVLTHELDGVVRGLKDWPRDERPPVTVVFFAFRIMLAIGFGMLGLVILGWILGWHRPTFNRTWFLRLCEWSMPFGFIAILAGWTVTEVGRQPWTVYGLMRTGESVTPSLTGLDVLISLVLYMVVYLLVYPVALIYIARTVRKGPPRADEEEEESPVESGRPRRPVDALPAGVPGRNA